ncbi:MAG: hypothetical protein A3F78_17210 [Burkholderiales bacterium RIFCSPLOWO2_12_FULL_61_40]|nr:MAG: hypothetical protein A3F78_17210 [Burkholderiales bacterium RIFCSPLOWO2_12_FULL_61_40]
MKKSTHVQRMDAVDLMRGLAMLWMTVFHFCFDLNQAGYLHQNFYADPLWTWQRTCILSLFLLCAGFSQAIALQQGQSWRQFGRRWAQIAGCALLVTVGSAWMFPHSFIYFGVLHGMAVMLVIVRLTAGWGGWLWPLGALAIATKIIAAYAITTGGKADFLNERMFNWLGLISVKPITEDYVPIVPWLGVMWWGMAAGMWWMAKARSSPPVPRMLNPVVVLGRWSLSYYMLHQPVLLGGLWLWAVF